MTHEVERNWEEGLGGLGGPVAHGMACYKGKGA